MLTFGNPEDKTSCIIARVVVRGPGEGASEEFDVNIGLRQDSVLSPLLFITVLDLKKLTQGECI